MNDRPQAAYKVLTADQLAALQRDGRFGGSADDRRDGYIHLSTAEQLTQSVDRHFAGQPDLAVVAVDLMAYSEDAMRWESSRDGRDFPHLYQPLSLATVIAYGPLERDADGQVRLPVAG